MLTKNIRLKKFGIKNNKNKIKPNLLRNLVSLKDHKLIRSFSKDYVFDFSDVQIKKFKKFQNYNLIGMGGSSLGSKAIYNFLKPKIKKKFIFMDNLNSIKNNKKKSQSLNIIISKSGNTLETISNYSTLKDKKK